MCAYNPVRWASRKPLALAAIQHVQASGSPVTFVECQVGDRPFEFSSVPNINFVGVRASGENMVWNKEGLWNIGIENLPDQAEYIHTMDADVRYRAPTWAEDTVHALQHYQVIQPWEHCYDLGPKGEHMELHTSFASLFFKGLPILQGPGIGAYKSPYKFGHPGYSWAYRREALDKVGGLIETAALGAADHHMALGLVGRVMESVPSLMTDGYIAPLKLWQKRAVDRIKYNIGYLPGTIEHSFHGSKRLRAYVDRWSILIKNKFDPFYDLRRNTYGVMELDGNKPALRLAIDTYFRGRLEDSNVA